jgi:hypothetical protein
MILFAYIVCALVAGVSMGASLGFMMNAQTNGVSESRRCLVLAGAALTLLGCGVGMNALNSGLAADPIHPVYAVLAVALGLGAAISRWPLRG